MGEKSGRQCRKKRIHRYGKGKENQGVKREKMECGVGVVMVVVVVWWVISVVSRRVEEDGGVGGGLGQDEMRRWER